MPAAELSQGRLLAAIKNLTLLNDRFFKRCLKGQKRALGRIFSLILNEPDLQIATAETEETLPNLYNRGVRLDATGTDTTGRILNLEMQAERHGAEFGRALYNGALICSSKAEMGTPFPNLPKVGIVFAVVADMSGDFGGDAPVWHIDFGVRETGKTLKSWLQIVYVNASPKHRDPTTPLGQLMCDLAQPDPSQMYNQELADCVRPYKKKMILGEDKEMSDFIKTEFASELQDARVEAQRMTATRMAINMLAFGYPLENIAQCAELPLSEVAKLKEEQDKGRPALQ